MAVVSACELLIGGMTCTACTGAVQGALLKHPGVIEAKVDILRETARIAYESGSVTPDSLCNVVQGLGFDAQVLQIFFSNANSQPTDATCESPAKPQEPQREIPQADCANDGEAQMHIPSTFYVDSRARPADLTGTLRFGIPETNEAAEACRRLEAIQGVLKCSLVPTKRLSEQKSIQLAVTYRPDIVGARQLVKNQAVLEAEASVKNALLFSLGPAVAVVCLSVLGRRHTLPPALLLTILMCVLARDFKTGGCSWTSAVDSDIAIPLNSYSVLRRALFPRSRSEAYVYSVLSCIQTAVTNLWCRPLLLASAAAAASATAADTAFDELLRNSDPQNFFDTCAMLTCVVLLGKLLQLRAKARILTQLHSLHDLQATEVRLVQRSPIPAVASHIQSAEEQRFLERAESHQEQQEPHDAFMEVSTGVADAGEPKKLASVARWWEKLTSALDPHRRQHKYNPLFHPGTFWVEDDAANEASSGPECCKKGRKSSLTNAASEIPEEVSISAELLQVGDVVRVAPNEVIPADGILLAPEVLHLDEKLISGEGRAVSRFASQRVIGGSRNASCTDGYVRVEVVGDASVLHTLLRLVYDAQEQQVPLQKTAASFASYFIPCVLCVTVAAIATWMVKVFAASDATPLSPLQHMSHRLREAELKEGVLSAQQQASFLQHLQYSPQQQQLHDPIDMFLAVSAGRLSSPLKNPPPAATFFRPADTAAAAVACKLSSWAVTWDKILFALRFGVAVCCAACPCAIGLAAPAAVAAATAAAAARGIFFKSGRALETAAKANLLVLDKTGTLTTGELQVAACALDKLRVAELLIPAVIEAGRFGVVKPSGKAELLGAIPSGNGTKIIPRKSCCWTSSTINSSSGTMDGDTASDSALGSMSSKVTFEDTGGSSQHPQDAVPIQEQAELDLQQCIKSDIKETLTPPAGAEAFEGTQDSDKNVAYLDLRDLWKISPNDISASSGPLERHGNCCGSNTCDGPQGGTNDSGLFRSENDKISLAEPNSETATATGCFLWALSCLEQGNNHAIGMALVSAYDRWLRASSGPMQNGQSSAAARERPPQLRRPPQRCEGVLLLPRGVEGVLRPQQNGPTLRLRVIAASFEDGSQARSCCGSISNTGGYSTEEIGCLQAWTEWHESNTGPVVSLHAFVSSSKNDPETGSWVWLGSVALKDEVQHEAEAAICALRRSLGFRIFMCTGDNPRTAARVAATFGIPLNCVRAQQRPADKVAFLRSLHSSTVPNIIDQTPPAVDRAGDRSPPASTVVKEGNARARKTVCCMIGDGLNDAPALAAAALGVAFGVGSALPVAAADVAVGGNSWAELVDLFRIAKKMRSIIQWNFLWACAFNLIAVPLAAGIAYPTVSLHPAAAAAAMAGSCLVVLLNAQRLSRFKATTHERLRSELLLSRLKTGTETSPPEPDEKALMTYPSHSESFLPHSLQSKNGQAVPVEVLQQSAACGAVASTEAFCFGSKAFAVACSTQGHEENPFSGTRRSSLLSETSAAGAEVQFDAKTDEHSSLSGMLLA
ncbi:hypothetical protein Esti_002338 [Eimeria stiedai]